ncbi:MAG: arginine N-succinyltransferase [Sphingomicrobium sp.]
MSFRVRPARLDDADAIFEMAKLTGGGFTNLPADRDTLVEKLQRSDASFSREGDDQQADLYVFVLEDPAQNIIRGTCQVFGKVGVKQPFYSYHLNTLTQTSPELGKTFRNQMLSLTTDLEGSSEVGGLFLHPDSRSGGLGTLLARSRYLFIRQHRARFGERVLAELRGVMDDTGNSPFWDALAGRFFDMTFPEADQFNAIHGTRFIADLMPRTPIYVALLADSAQTVISQPHPSGRGALRMLEEEGFEFDRYVDIFDGGPTVTAATDDIRSVSEAKTQTVVEIGDGGDHKMLVARGRLKHFASCFAAVRTTSEGVYIDATTAELLGAAVGDELLTVGR